MSSSQRKISKLDSWDFSDTKEIYQDYGRKSIPEATPRNMVILMDKINELTRVVNKFIELNPAMAAKLEDESA